MNWIRAVFLEDVTSELRTEGKERACHEGHAGKAFQAEGRAGAKAPRWDHSWLMCGLERKQVAGLQRRKGEAMGVEEWRGWQKLGNAGLSQDIKATFLRVPHISRGKCKAGCGTV